MTAYTVVWNGTMHRQDEAHCSLLGDMAFRSNALLDAAPATSKVENRIKSSRVRHKKCACGYRITGSGHRQCWNCRMGKPPAVPFAKCSCGRSIRKRGQVTCAQCLAVGHKQRRGRYKVKAA